MSKHRSEKDRQLTEYGRALHAWWRVLYNDNASIYDCGDVGAMRELEALEDTPDNRALLCESAYRAGWPERDARELEGWVNAKDGFFSAMVRQSMRDEFESLDSDEEE